jgi:hypothetical protein
MRRYLGLVLLFWQHLIRRKSLWIVVALLGALTLINALIQSQMTGMLEQGVRYDIATRRAAASLDGYVQQIRGAAALLVVIVAALVAPASRKEGTSQFVLTLAVSRFRMAAGQFGALALFIALGTLVVHAGYCVAAYRLGILGPAEALGGWPLLLVPLLLAATSSFSLSLTRPPAVVYALLIVIPYVALPLLALFVSSWSTDVPAWIRLVSARFIDNAGLLFPDVGPLIAWPKLPLATSDRPPIPAWGWETAHQVAAVAFWVTAGLWAYRRYDFGSRIPTK